MAIGQLLTVRDVADLLNTKRSWVYQKAEDGTLPSFKLGHYRRFRAEAIEAYLHQCETAMQAQERKV